MRITLDDSDIKKPIAKERRRKSKKIRKRKVETSKDKKSIKKPLLCVLGTVVVVFLSYLLYLGYSAYRMGTDIGLILRPKDIISKEIPELKKDSTSKYTSALIVGIDTRDNMQLENTDTIIVATYNYDTKEVTMISIPRDFHVEISPGTYRFRRINSVYTEYEHQEDGLGLKQLANVVTEVTGIEIQYYAMFNYNGFVELIDAIGGIDVYVENTFTDYRYPAPDGGRQTIRFEKGPQNMDGETALKYARSRLSLQAGEGSDFARAKRQQNVITAVKDKILSETLLDPQSLMSLFGVVQDNLKMSEFTIKEVEAGIDILKEYHEKGENYSFVLDPTSGGGNLVTSRNVTNSGAYAIGPVQGLGNYEEIQDYIKHLFRNPQLYEQDPIIRVYNTGMGHSETLEKYNSLKEDFPYLKISYAGTLRNDKEGVISYINVEDEDFEYSLKILNKFVNPDSIEKPDFITSRLNGEDITILFGKEITIERTEN